MHSHSNRLLRLIAIERGFRAVVLVGAGAILLTHTHTAWGTDATRLAHALGLDTSRQGIHHIITRLSLLRPGQIAAFGVVAILYGILEGVEGYGLWRALPWAEYLTVFATSLLFIPEVWELSKSVTPLKLGGLIVNVAIVAYLIRRLRRERRGAPGSDAAAVGGPG